jgi:hypothetical protein
LLAAILAPHAGWLVVPFFPGLPRWSPAIVMLPLLGLSLWWLYLLMLRRGRITDLRQK